ncbi:tetratricopeptide repeat protein 33-like [Mercenaria mercenaria]|uniref:tetratricopeptide repeat protein 33-like n=1 Tax=Mercenaria mercenaria TaxID=6596 RepID=UPI00234F0843|nr:tetratricopeptide repeat protein 33-like [Mercenaria mercenaria]
MANEGVKKFGWKRKIGAQVSKSASSAFEEESKEEGDVSLSNGEVDWLTLAPIKRRTVIGLEDGVAKANRLVQEGTVLAGSERYWEALKKWEEALQYTPCDEKIHEMKAQALMELCEVFPAVQSAKKAVEYGPTWWIAHQTLGRAYLGLGEVKMAVDSFSRAVHLNPGSKELWEDDLMWAYSLLQKRQKLEEEKKQILKEKFGGGVKIVEVGSDIDTDVDDEEKAVDIYRQVHEQGGKKTEGKSLRNLPTNYVQMRDPLPP